MSEVHLMTSLYVWMYMYETMYAWWKNSWTLQRWFPIRRSWGEIDVGRMRKQMESRLGALQVPSGPGWWTWGCGCCLGSSSLALNAMSHTPVEVETDNLRYLSSLQWKTNAITFPQQLSCSTKWENVHWKACCCPCNPGNHLKTKPPLWLFLCCRCYWWCLWFSWVHNPHPWSKARYCDMAWSQIVCMTVRTICF